MYIVFASVWVRALVACMDIVFSVCLGSLVRLSKGVVINSGDYGTAALRQQHCNSTDYHYN